MKLGKRPDDWHFSVSCATMGKRPIVSLHVVNPYCALWQLRRSWVISAEWELTATIRSNIPANMHALFCPAKPITGARDSSAWTEGSGALALFIWGRSAVAGPSSDGRRGSESDVATLQWPARHESAPEPRHGVPFSTPADLFALPLAHKSARRWSWNAPAISLSAKQEDAFQLVCVVSEITRVNTWSLHNGFFFAIRHSFWNSSLLCNMQHTGNNNFWRDCRRNFPRKRWSLHSKIGSILTTPKPRSIISLMSRLSDHSTFLPPAHRRGEKKNHCEEPCFTPALIRAVRPETANKVVSGGEEQTPHLPYRPDQ